MPLHYFFEEIKSCEMCGDSTNAHKVLGQRLNQTQGLRPSRRSGISVSIKQCSKCNLIYSSPMPVPFDLQDHYGIPPESYWKHEYFEVKQDYFLNQIENAKELLTYKSGMTALDVGAGLGKCMIALENAGFNAYGFEPSVPFYERAISKMKVNPKKLKLGDIENVEYSQNSFNFITFGAVFEHLYHPAKCLEKAIQWLRPGGIIHVEVPSSKWLIPKLVNAFYRLTGTNYVTNLSPMHVPFHLYEFDLKSFSLLREKVKYKIERYKYDVCSICYVPNFSILFSENI